MGGVAKGFGGRVRGVASMFPCGPAGRKRGGRWAFSRASVRMTQLASRGCDRAEAEW